MQQKHLGEMNSKMNKNKLRSFGFAAAITLLFAMTQGVGATTISNPGTITIPDSGAATPYPSDIAVSGVTGSILDVNVTLSGLSHTFPDDLDILLVGPSGVKIFLMSDVGGSFDVNGINLTFDDAAASFLPNSTQMVSGTFKPSDGVGGPADNFPAPAPGSPYGLLLSAFNGLNPNGTWSLFVLDDAAQDIGGIANGWSLDITTVPNTVPEPSTLVLFGAGVLGLVARKRKETR